MDKTSISYLRDSIKGRMSEKRYIHSLAVVESAKKIGEYCLADKLCELSCAALLHDVAKELDEGELRRIIKESYQDSERILSYGVEVWHSYAAPCVIKRDFPVFATDEILSATKKHTVGSADMSVFDEIIFISDYVEPGRTYHSCIKVREYLFSSLKPDEMENNIQILHKACIMATNYTIDSLKSRGASICPESLLLKNALESKIKK